MTEETDIVTHVVAVFAFVMKDDKLLLAKRSNSDPQAGGAWSIPGGKVEMEVGANVLEENIKREVREEVGLEITGDIEYVCNDGFTRVSGHHVIGIYFLTHWLSGEARPLEDHEEIAWYTIDELTHMDELPNYLKSRIERLAAHLKK